MIESRDMERYIVLDFTVKQPMKPRPGNTPLPLYRGHLYHVLFPEYRGVGVIDASDLSIVASFALMGNADLLA